MSDTIAEIMEKSREHPVVGFALQSLAPQEDGTFAPPATLTEALTKKLSQLGHDADLLAAVFGLNDLAGFLGGDRNSPAVASAIYAALSTTTEAVREAVDAVSITPEVLGELRENRFSAFLGGDDNRIAEATAPAEGEVRAGPMARFSMPVDKEE